MKSEYLDVFEKLALEAGRFIMNVRDGGYALETKSDASPVTEADRGAEELILAGLRRSFPDIAIVAEEDTSQNGTIPVRTEAPFFLVDPLDGTREFVKGGSDFTVNIALIAGGVPVAGLVHVPARGQTYCGHSTEAWKNDETGGWVKLDPGEASSPTRIVASRSHRTLETDEWIANVGPHDVVSVGSSLKFCLLAEGRADVYPRFGRTMEWDTAAGDAVLRAAGGLTTTIDNSVLMYGKPSGADVAFANPHFIAYARAQDVPSISG